MEATRLRRGNVNRKNNGSQLNLDKPDIPSSADSQEEKDGLGPSGVVTERGMNNKTSQSALNTNSSENILKVNRKSRNLTHLADQTHGGVKIIVDDGVTPIPRASPVRDSETLPSAYETFLSGGKASGKKRSPGRARN